MNLNLPTALYGGDSVGLIKAFGLRVERSPENPGGTWQVSALDDVAAVTCKTLHSPALRRQRFDVSTVPTPAVKGGISSDMIPEFHRYREKLAADTSLPSVVQQIISTLISVPDAEVPTTIQWASQLLDSLPVEVADGSTEPLFPRHSVHDIRIDHRVHLWVKLPQIFMRLEHNTVAEVIAEFQSDGGELVFQSSAALTEATVLGGLFFAPLLTNLMPTVWGFGVPRIEQTVIYAFGRQLAGLNDTGAPPNLVSTLQALVHTSPARSFDTTRLNEESLHKNMFAEAVEWWTERMNQMILDLYSPTTYRDSNESYVPAVHQQWILNVEQLLHRISAIGLNPREQTVQLGMMMAAMDIFGDSIYECGNIGSLMRPSKIAKTIDAVELRVPERCRELIVAPARRALAAAQQTGDGFFLPSPNPETTADSRLADFWNARRNTTHGFRNNTGILTQHNGKLPADIVLVPMVYLLDLLTDRKHLLSRISRQCLTP